MTDADERRMVEAAQRDPSRFGDLYERHFDRVYAFVVRRVRDRDVAEDVTSDVFHKALATLPPYEGRGAPVGARLVRLAATAGGAPPCGPWLRRIAPNAGHDRGRRPVEEPLLDDVSASQPTVDDDLDEIE